MAFRQNKKSMKELHVALKFIQNKLRGDEKIVITKEGFDIQLIQSKNDLPPMQAEDAGNIINGLVEDADTNPVPRSIDGVDVEMYKQIYDQ
tara:strand:+ start:94 stop:366 length:273 start_codon:yes stop_codon:yes gene_type:complete